MQGRGFIDVGLENIIVDVSSKTSSHWLYLVWAPGLAGGDFFYYDFKVWYGGKVKVGKERHSARLNFRNSKPLEIGGRWKMKNF